MNWYLLAKTAHIVFVVTWFAGLFYLPRLFVYHVDTTDTVGHQRFVLMERRLLRMIHVTAGLAVLSGVAVLLTVPAFMKAGWLHAKLLLVALLYAYTIALGPMARAFAQGRNTRTARWYRFYNEVPGILLIAIVSLVVWKPF